mgnify:CR=1 FL=1
MYAIKNPGLWDLDPTTGAGLGWKLTTPNAGVTTAFTSTGGRLINLGAVGSPTGLQVLSINPADASITVHGSIGNWWGAIIETHPVSEVVYFIGDNPRRLATLDLATGQRTDIAALTGAPTGAPTAMAIRSDGAAFVVLSTKYLASLELSTGVLTPLGQIQGPMPLVSLGLYEDAAFDRFGQLWAEYYVGSTGGASAFAYNGLYKIDTTTFTAVRMQAFNERFEIAFAPDCTCSTYCTGKVNGAGCIPTIDRDGLPSPTAQLGFEITGTNVVNATAGTLAWGVAGRVANPFHSGTWCVRSPMKRTPLQQSGGSATPIVDCSGAWTLDFNTYMQSTGTLPVGTTIDCQWYGRDPSLPPPHNVQLSNALEFVLMP